jgi:hypothetical protein
VYRETVRKGVFFVIAMVLGAAALALVLKPSAATKDQLLNVAYWNPASNKRVVL